MTGLKNTDTKKIFTIALPLICQQIFLQLKVYIDRAMLGHVNSDFFSAIGNVLVPYNAVLSVITSICTGTTILIAHNIGAKNEDMYKKYAECSYLGNTLISVIAFFFFFFCSGFLFKIMGVKSPILELSASYLKIMSFSFLIFGIYSTSISIIQGIGLTKIIMITGIISNVINISLDYALIFGKFGFPRMEIRGAALASFVSTLTAALIISFYVFKSKRMPFRFNIKDVIYSKINLYKDVLKKGLPTGFEMGLFSVGNIFIISFLNRIEASSVGVYTLIYSIQLIPLLFYMGLAQATLTLTGHKTGEGDPVQAIITGFKALKFSLIVCAIFAFLFILFPKSIVRIFTNDISFIEDASKYFILIAFTMFPKAANIVIGHGIRGTGDTKWMLYTQIFGTVFVLILSYIFIFITDIGLTGIFITYLSDETIRSIINTLRFWKGRDFLKRKT